MSARTVANPLGVHALIWVGDTSPASVEHAVRQTAAAGFDLLELSLHDLEQLDVEHGRALLERAGIGIVCSRGLTFDADVSSDDTAVVERGAHLLSASLEATVGLGGRLLTGALYSALGKYPGPVTDRGRRNAISVLAALAQEARRHGASLGLEVVNRYESNVVNTARQALELVDAIGEDNVLIHLDTYHMNIEEDDLSRPVRQVGARLGYVHVGESHRGGLGAGHLDFDAFFHTLRDVGYRGPVTFEAFSSAVVAPGLSHDLAIWRDLWTDGRELAAHAREFLTAHISAEGSAPDA